MYKLIKVLHLNTVEMYYQYCPMAEEGKGAYWLSEQPQIKNPYMGKKMLTCGSTKETISLKK
jgi:Cu(I)/Ag(I) efflux system membrane fusion protein